MKLDYETLAEMKKRNAAWRLLLADSAPLILSFLNDAFVVPNVRLISEHDLEERLEDFLYAIRETQRANLFPRPAIEYLKEWAEPEKEWLRRFYPLHADEPHYDITPASERAIGWIASLSERSFIGAESRLKVAFDLLQQIVEGAETDPAARIEELRKRRAELGREIERIESGYSVPMDDTALKERFMQFSDTASSLLGDFRSVESNFRRLDRDVRQKIAVWSDSKGALLGEILNAREAIEASDQGRSFRAFSDFLLLRSRQQEFGEKLSRALEIEAIRSLEPDERIARILYSWIEAGDHVLRTISQLSSQLRIFLDNRAWLENRRIAEILRSIESNAVAVKGHRPSGVFMEIEGDEMEVDLPMERPLFNPAAVVRIVSDGVLHGEAAPDEALLFDREWVDRELLAGRIALRVKRSGQTSLAALIEEFPLEKGLDELLTYVSIASELEGAVFDESESERVSWRAQGEGLEERVRVATIPKIIFTG